MVAFAMEEFDAVAARLGDAFPPAVAAEPTEVNFRSMLLAARDALPEDPRILEILAMHAKISRPIEGSDFSNVVATQVRFSVPSREVCEIKPAKSTAGTGFLVGPDLVLTAAHVVRHTTGEWMDPSEISIRFDTLVWKDDTLAELVRCRVHPTERFPLAFSLAPLDERVDPTAEELDYALFRITPSIGAQDLPNAPVRRRGWFDCSAAILIPQAQANVSVLQYPNGKVQQSASGQIVQIGTNATRVFYKASTSEGSSGGPVLDENNRVVALHVWSDRFKDDQIIANEGVALSAIQVSLTAQNISLPPTSAS